MNFAGITGGATGVEGSAAVFWQLDCAEEAQPTSGMSDKTCRRAAVRAASTGAKNNPVVPSALNWIPTLVLRGCRSSAVESGGRRTYSSAIAGGAGNGC